MSLDKCAENGFLIYDILQNVAINNFFLMVRIKNIKIMNDIVN